MKDAASYAPVVQKAAQKLNMLDATGGLVEMDSLAIIDLVVELERVCKMKIPIAGIKQESFKTIDSIATMLSTMKSE